MSDPTPADPLAPMAERVAEAIRAATVVDRVVDRPAVEVPLMALHALSPSDCAELAVSKGGMVASCHMVVGDLMDDGGIVYDGKGRGKVTEVCAVCKDPQNPDWNERWPCRKYAGSAELRRAALYRKADEGGGE